MACNEPTPGAGNNTFITRVEILGPPTESPLWPGETQQNVGLPYGQDRLIMNIPNGAGPGTVLLQSEDAYMDWRIVDTKNKVQSTQRAYTGPASWAEVFVDDGCFIHARAQSVATTHWNVDGVRDSVAIPEAKLRTLWYPSATTIPTFDRLSLIAGTTTPAAANGFPMRFIGNNSTEFFVPPGLCRYFQISLVGDYEFDMWFNQTHPYTETGVTRTGLTYGFCPAWLSISVKNTSGALAGYSICWSRFPMTGGT